MEKLKGKIDANPMEYCNVILSSDEIEEAIREIKRVLHETKDEVVVVASNKVVENRNVEAKTVARKETSCIEPPPHEPTSIPKLGNPGKFAISCSLGDLEIDDALCDSGASVNVISYEMVKSLGIKDMKQHSIPIMFGDASLKHPLGLIEDYPLNVGNCLVPTDLMVVKMEQCRERPLVLGTPFLNTVGATIDFPNKRVTFKNVNANVFYPIKTYSTEFCGTITSREMKPQDEVKIVNERMNLASPPKACKKKKDSHEEKALGYGNVEEALALDGTCLESLFHTAMENEKESIKVREKGEGTKAKKKKPKDNHPSTLVKGVTSMPNEVRSVFPKLTTMTLTPWRYEDGVVEYKIKCKGRSKPFATVRAIITPELKEKGATGIQEIMSKVLTLKLNDQPWSSTTPSLHA